MTPPPADTATTVKATTNPAGTPAVDVVSTAGEGRTLRRRNCDPATSLDLKALDDAGVRYEIVESSPAATVLRLTHQDLHNLANAVAGRGSDAARWERGPLMERVL